MSARRRSNDALYVRSLGPRELDALRMVEEHPGITVGELREALGVGASRVWQIVGRLEMGRVLRQRPAPAARPDDLNVKVRPRDLPRRVAAPIRPPADSSSSSEISNRWTSRAAAQASIYSRCTTGEMNRSPRR